MFLSDKKLKKQNFIVGQYFCCHPILSADRKVQNSAVAPQNKFQLSKKSNHFWILGCHKKNFFLRKWYHCSANGACGTTTVCTGSISSQSQKISVLKTLKCQKCPYWGPKNGTSSTRKKFLDHFYKPNILQKWWNCLWFFYVYHFWMVFKSIFEHFWPFLSHFPISRDPYTNIVCH